MSKIDYVKEAMRQLEDNQFYTRLSEDPTNAFLADIKHFLQSRARAEDLTSLDIDLLTPSNPRCSVFYLLPKIHKPYSLPDSLPPGRPIVSSYGCVTERISAYVDDFLQPLMKSQPSYCRDTYHFLDLLRATDLPSISNRAVLLVVIDVNSLYSTIPHQEGLEAIRHFLNQRPPPLTPSTNFLVDMAELVLTKNAFVFQDKHYLQVLGTAMGTRMAPSYASLYMARLEQEFLSTMALMPLLWIRFLDDIFVLWDHGEEALLECLENLNNRFSVKFSHTYSSTSVTFLDVDVSIDGNTIHTSVHIKPTNAQQYLHYTSCHPSHTKKAIPYSLSIRGHRICDERRALENYLTGLFGKLQERGYPARSLKQQIIPAGDHYIQRPRRDVSNEVFLSLTYFPGAYKIGKVLKDLYPVLSAHPLTNNVFPSTPKLAYRRPPNLGNILSHKGGCSTRQRSRSGLSPCNSPRCKTCGLVLEDLVFTSPSAPSTYPVSGGPTTCTSRNCVYRLVCQHCDSYYVGLASTQLNLRINNHRSSVVRNQNLPVSQHARFHSSSFDDCFRVQVLNSIPLGDKTTLRASEQAHIWVLGAHQPPGLNVNR